MNYFSYLYQCNMIRMFPLRAGVIGFVNLQEPGSLSVSPVWGYRGTTD